MKEFKTIMIRGLDEPENKPLVEIMNMIIERYPEINTGQAVVQFIIKDWFKLKNELIHQVRQRNEYEHKTIDQINHLQEELMKYQQIVNNFKTALKAITTIK